LLPCDQKENYGTLKVLQILLVTNFLKLCRTNWIWPAGRMKCGKNYLPPTQRRQCRITASQENFGKGDFLFCNSCNGTTGPNIGRIGEDLNVFH